MKTVWIEAALNGPWGRVRQPNIPISVDEIVTDGLAAAHAGAAIIHLHAYDEARGRQRDDWEVYARIIEGIRAKADVIVYPTIPMLGSEFAGPGSATRYAHTRELAQRGLIEWTVCDPGTVNMVRFDQLDQPKLGFVYQNSPHDIAEGFDVARTFAIRPGYAIYEPGFTRLGAALAAIEPRVPTPVYRFMFSDEFAWGFPPKAVHLDSHLALLNDLAPHAPWMVAGLGVDILPLVPAAIARGGHVRVGLEDAPWGSALSNAQWVERAVKSVREGGGEPAMATQVRAALAECDIVGQAQ